MHRFPATQARKQLEEAMTDCTSIRSLAQVLVFIIEAGHLDVIHEARLSDRLRQALTLVAQSTRLL